MLSQLLVLPVIEMTEAEVVTVVMTAEVAAIEEEMIETVANF
jgi:hypothetical protein